MQQIEKTLELELDSLEVLDAFLQHTDDTYCFFDIETTGLSADISSLYLIGALWYEPSDKKIHTMQWFADDYISEAAIIDSFREFLGRFTTLVHYNGSGFDIPYLEKKCRILSISSPFGTLNKLDIYREIKRLKPLFHTANLKLSTIEKLIGFMRRDTLTGKDCIQTYSQFMQRKYFRDSAMESEKQKLLLHNQEDIIGTFYAARLLSYKCGGALFALEDTAAAATACFQAPCTFPFPVEYLLSAGQDSTSFSVTFENQMIFLNAPLRAGCLYHFFKNYKNYYYLPAEDTAIHRSVGEYVEKEFREPARASNCYVKKEGIFLPLPDKYVPEHQTLFCPGYKKKPNYILWDDKTKQNSSLMEEILLKILSI